MRVPVRYVLYDQENYDEAAAKYQEAIERDPKLPLPYYNWGIVLYDQKKYDEANQKFLKARELMSSQ